MNPHEELQEDIAHLIPREPPYPQFIEESFFLELQDLLKDHEDQHIRAWKRSPRLYLLLRMLGHTHESAGFARFDERPVGYGDGHIEIEDWWLPLKYDSLKQIASAIGISLEDAARLNRLQKHVLSKPELMNEESLFSLPHKHRHIRSGGTYFKEMETLGQGGSAEVTRVRHNLSHKEFACKRIRRADPVKLQSKQLLEFRQERDALLRINRHRHFVCLEASWLVSIYRAIHYHANSRIITDKESFSLIISPVAEDDLKSVLERQSREQPLPPSDIAILRHAFGCLATAMAYLHRRRIRHKDVKPKNILLYQGRFLLCDFGISRQFSESGEPVTVDHEALKYTRRYCAPEVSERNPRSNSADIWSLGCVFLEIVGVVKGYTFEEITRFLDQHTADTNNRGQWCAPNAVESFVAELKSKDGDSADDLALSWITTMTRLEPRARPEASHIVEKIRTQSSLMLSEHDLFLAPCCAQDNGVTPTSIVDSPGLQATGANGLGIDSLSPNAHRPGSHNESRPTFTSLESASLNPNPSETTAGPAGRSMETVTLSTNAGVEVPPDTPTLAPPPRDSPTLPSRVPPAPGPVLESQHSPPGPLKSCLEVRCACSLRPREKHIFTALYAPRASTSERPFVFSYGCPTIETDPRCEVGSNQVHIYETPPSDPSRINPPLPWIWWVTRRVVVSYLSGAPPTRRCSSFWIPLADLQFSLYEKAVKLRWSDCNQIVRRQAVNGDQPYDWRYVPKQPNNEIEILFRNAEDAQNFVNTIRLPYQDGVVVNRERKIDVSETAELRIFDIGQRGRCDYSVATLTTVTPTISWSKFFIIWPEVDLDVRIQDCQENEASSSPKFLMTVGIKNVNTPTYQSDVQGEPAFDLGKVAKFDKAQQIKANLVVQFPIDTTQDLRTPPPCVVAMLHGLSGWNLRYFAIVETKKSFRIKPRKSLDIMLWHKDFNPSVGWKRREGVITLRRHDEKDYFWKCGTITPASKISTDDLNATFTMANQTKGRLLNITNMTAIASDCSANSSEAHLARPRSPSKQREKMTKLVLTFQNAKDRLTFHSLFDEFKDAAVVGLSSSRAGSLTDSVSRIDSLNSNRLYMTPSIQ